VGCGYQSLYHDETCATRHVFLECEKITDSSVVKQAFPAAAYRIPWRKLQAVFPAPGARL
jgi:hypothetical protein